MSTPIPIPDSMLGKPTPERRPGDSLQRVLALAASSKPGECSVVDFIRPNNSGYAYVTIDGRRVGAHRFVCAVAHGDPVAPRTDAAHSCRNRTCVNPHHLRWATRSENLSDRTADGTDHRGSRNPQAKLCNDEVRQLRRLRTSGVLLKDLAGQFGIAESTACRIAQGAFYSDVAS